MPHLMIVYSPNMETRVDMEGLCNTLRLAAIETGVLPMAGIRVGAIRADHACLADGDADHGYIDISVRLREGRSLLTRKMAIALIFDAAKAFLAPAMAKYPIALSLEMRQIDAELAPKTSTIAEHLGKG
ncbi:MAG: 5-carboxymethyl-2-hydroxymuconate isomerase [Marinosulfonomonas sp.]|nr:5-carboxymethyl-2-hydroxymuconate isomerase [Marinosulfonomonas sp.]